jgi:hypothetical protein
LRAVRFPEWLGAGREVNLVQQAGIRASCARSTSGVGVGLATVDARPSFDSAARHVGVAVAGGRARLAAMRSRVALDATLGARCQAQAGRAGGGCRATDRRALSA